MLRLRGPDVGTDRGLEPGVRGGQLVAVGGPLATACCAAPSSGRRPTCPAPPAGSAGRRRGRSGCAAAMPGGRPRPPAAGRRPTPGAAAAPPPGAGGGTPRAPRGAPGAGAVDGSRSAHRRAPPGPQSAPPASLTAREVAPSRSRPPGGQRPEGVVERGVVEQAAVGRPEVADLHGLRRRPGPRGAAGRCRDRGSACCTRSARPTTCSPRSERQAPPRIRPAGHVQLQRPAGRWPRDGRRSQAEERAVPQRGGAERQLGVQPGRPRPEPGDRHAESRLQERAGRRPRGGRRPR